MGAKIDLLAVKKAMATNCLNVADLSKVSGVNVLTLHRVFNGVRTPRLSTIGRIAKGLNVSVDDIAVFE